MFKFHKVRGPEQIGEALTTLEESANRLESIVETAQKEKSRLHLLVGNVSDRVAQIRETAASFEQTATKISDYDISIKALHKEIEAVKKDANSIRDMRAETTKLLEQFGELKAQLKNAQNDLSQLQRPAVEMTALQEKVNKTKTDIEPQLESINSKQAEISNKYNDFINRLSQAETQLQRLSEISVEFEKAVEKVSRESARITTWMAATEKMSQQLDQSTEIFETTKEKVDHLHELAEFVESKIKGLSKQKELLKNAHIEYGQANILFLEIKSKLSELEQDTEQLKQIQIKASDFEMALKSIEGRFDKIDGHSEKLDEVLEGFSRLESYARELEQKQNQLESIGLLTDRLTKQSDTARADLKQLADATEKINQSLKQSEEIQNESRVIMQHMIELIANSEKLLDRVPDIGKVLDEIESIRKRSLVLENKLLENMAVASEIKSQADTAGDIKVKVDLFRQESAKTLSLQKKEIESLGNAITGLKGNLESMRSRWLEMPEILAKLAETEKQIRSLDKRYGSLLERENEVMSLRGLIDQNTETFKKFETTVARVHQKATDVLNFKSELEKIDLKISALDSGVKSLLGMSEKIEKISNESNSLGDKISGLNSQMKDAQKQSETVTKECATIRKAQENLRLDAGEVMDLFTKLSDMRTLAEEKTKELSEAFGQTGQRIIQLNQIGDKAQSRMDEHRKGLSDIKDEISTLSNAQHDLSTKFAYLDKESDKMVALSNALKQRQSEISNLSDKVAALEYRLKDAYKLDEKLAEFERAFEKTNSWTHKMSERLAEMAEAQSRLEGYHQQFNELESRLASVSSKAAEIDKLQKNFTKINLMSEELKAKESSLKNDEALVNRAIAATSKLEELIQRAEHLAKSGK